MGLGGYDEHCCLSVDLNSSFLDQVFSDAGVPRYATATDTAPLSDLAS